MIHRDGIAKATGAAAAAQRLDPAGRGARAATAADRLGEDGVTAAFQGKNGGAGTGRDRDQAAIAAAIAAAAEGKHAARSAGAAAAAANRLSKYAPGVGIGRHHQACSINRNSAAGIARPACTAERQNAARPAGIAAAAADGLREDRVRIDAGRGDRRIGLHEYAGRTANTARSARRAERNQAGARTAIAAAAAYRLRKQTVGGLAQGYDARAGLRPHNGAAASATWRTGR